MNRPTAVKRESRISFGISWFATEEEAQAYHEIVRKQDRRYNGGWLHGHRCGRDKAWDHVDPERGKLFAVTD